MPRREEQPVHSEPAANAHGGVEESHPAFGVAVVTRGHGTPRALFQSDVLHRDVITLSIQHATRTRDLNHDWVHGREPLVEIEMSLSQWGALVSSVGIGSGIPVTIRRTEGEPFTPELPHQPRLQASVDEASGAVEKMLERAAETLAAVEEAFESKKGIRAVRDALRDHRAAIANAPSNAAFAIRSVTEAGERVTSQVRADIEAQILTAAQRAGSQPTISAPVLERRDLGDRASTPTIPIDPTNSEDDDA